MIIKSITKFTAFKITFKIEKGEKVPIWKVVEGGN